MKKKLKIYFVRFETIEERDEEQYALLMNLSLKFIQREIDNSLNFKNETWLFFSLKGSYESYESVSIMQNK